MSTAVRSRFFLFAGLFAATVVLAGFSRSYYFRAWFDRPPLTLLLHLHAAVFTAWIVLFVVQSRLAAARRMDWHRRLGVAGAVIALLMVITAGAAIVEAMGSGKTIAMMPAWQFVALSTVSITLFAGFVIAALFLRRRPDWHRRLMLLATIGILGPAVGRLLLMSGGPPATRYANLALVVMLAACLAYDAVRHRIVHPAFAIGASLLLLAIPGKQALARSALWADFARWIISG
jgi:hypothetical protein